MKVYFACSIRGGRENAHLYQSIVDSIKDTGADLLSELFADQSIDSNKGISVKKDMSGEEIWKWDLDWVNQADAVIAEVTQPSLGVGYEIAKAEEWGKPILTLFYKPSGKILSAMIEGSPKNTTYNYSTDDEADKKVKEFLKSIKK